MLSQAWVSEAVSMHFFVYAMRDGMLWPAERQRREAADHTQFPSHMGVLLSRRPGRETTDTFGCPSLCPAFDYASRNADQANAPPDSVSELLVPECSVDTCL